MCGPNVCTAVCSSQTFAYGVDVFALAGAQNTAVSVQIPAYNMLSYDVFAITFPNAVRMHAPFLPEGSEVLHLGAMQRGHALTRHACAGHA